MNTVNDMFMTDRGWIGVAANHRGLIGLVMPDPDPAAVRERLAELDPYGVLREGGLYPTLRSEMIAFFQGARVPLDFPVDWAVFTPFQARVLRTVQQIPFGETRSYRQVAELAGCGRGYRAVGGALRSNRIPLIIPCHRVIAHDGAPGGFTSPRGVSEKLFLLELEKRGFRQERSNN